MQLGPAFGFRASDGLVLGSFQVVIGSSVQGHGVAGRTSPCVDLDVPTSPPPVTLLSKPSTAKLRENLVGASEFGSRRQALGLHRVGFGSSDMGSSLIRAPFQGSLKGSRSMAIGFL